MRLKNITEAKECSHMWGFQVWRAACLLTSGQETGGKGRQWGCRGEGMDSCMQNYKRGHPCKY